MPSGRGKRILVFTAALLLALVVSRQSRKPLSLTARLTGRRIYKHDWKPIYPRPPFPLPITF